MAQSERVTWRTAGAEVSASRQQTWVALAGVAVTSRRVAVSLEDPLRGAQVAAELARLAERHQLEWLALDPRSPSATLAEPLKLHGVRVKLADTAGVAQAHGMFVDLLSGDRLRVRGNRALDDAVRLAEARRLAGSTAIDRYGAPVDAAPLMAAELAVWALGDPDELDSAPGAWVI